MDAEAAKAARQTPETWALEIRADSFQDATHVAESATMEVQRTRAAGTQITLADLMELGKTEGVSIVKAMQCLNIPSPLGQGVWQGVPLSAVLKKLCGSMENVRRINFWGFHNNDPTQKFMSSVSYTECMESVPGEPPVFLAYGLNDGPVPLGRGGPVRMVVPWAHGFKSVKWLTDIEFTNDYRAADTYASLDGMNDIASFLKTAAYVNKTEKSVAHGEDIVFTGNAISGRTPLERVEYWVRSVPPLAEGERRAPVLPDNDPELLSAPWQPCTLQAPPMDWEASLPNGISPEQVFGYDASTGTMPWPFRYGYVGWSATISGLPKGEYEIRARAVDAAGNAQPEPRPTLKSGVNAIQFARVAVE